jgi:hypothetical protein
MELIKSNERELAGKIAQWFTEEIVRGGYPFKSASNANQKLHSWNEAEKMASEILKEYNFEEI